MRARRRRQARVLPLAQAVLTGAHLLRLWSRRGGCALLIAMMALLADLGGLIVFGLKVGESTVRLWTKNARTAQERQRRARAWSLWLDGLSYDEIAAELDTPKATIGNWISSQNANLSELGRTPPGATEDRPWGNIAHFDIWQFPTADKDDGQQSYFGAVPPQVMENLLWFYTEPGDVVVDLFAGSGTTIDVAKRMGRRVWASDVNGDKYSPD